MSIAIRLVRRGLLILGLPTVLVVLWWFGSADSTNFFWPPLSRILRAGVETWSGRRLLDDLLPSVLRFAAGYTTALVVGIGLGVLIGSIRWLRSLLEPTLEFLRAIPPPVLVPIIMLFAGIGHTEKVLVIISGCLWPILLNTVEGVRGVDEVLSDTCRSYRIRGLLRLRQFVLRAASPQIMTGARQSLAIGLILMVISEMIAAFEGLGFFIVQSQRGFQMPETWSGVLLLGLLGVTLALLFRLVERRVLYWYHGVRAAERGSR